MKRIAFVAALGGHYTVWYRDSKGNNVTISGCRPEILSENATSRTPLIRFDKATPDQFQRAIEANPYNQGYNAMMYYKASGVPIETVGSFKA